MHTKFERLLSKSLTTLELMTYYLVVHTGPEERQLIDRSDRCRGSIDAMVDYRRLNSSDFCYKYIGRKLPDPQKMTAVPAVVH